MILSNEQHDSERLLFTTEHRAIWLAAIIGLSLSMAALWLIRQQLEAHKMLDFEWVAHNRIRALHHGIDNGLLAITSIRDFYMASDDVGPSEFQVFAEPLLGRHKGIQTLMWVSRIIGPQGDVSGDDAENKSLLIERSQQRFRLESGDQQYNSFAVTNIAPAKESNAVLSHSFISNPAFMEVLRRARNSGKMAASGHIDFMPGKENSEYGFMVSLPVYRKLAETDTELQRQENLLGFVVGLYKLDDLVNASISLLEPRGVEILLLDESADSGSWFLHFYASRLAPRNVESQSYIDWLNWVSEAKVSERIQVADRQWSIVCGRTDLFRSAEAFQESPWAVLVAGLLFTMLLSFYLVRIKENARERTKMQLQLAEREELFRQMTETVDEVFWAITADGAKQLYLSPAYDRVFGSPNSKTEKQGLLILDAVPEEDSIQLVNTLQQIREDSVPAEVIHRVNRADGTMRWVRTRGFPVTDNSGQICRIVGFVEDITEKKLADEALKDSEAKLRDMFQQSPDIIMTVDIRGKILLMNRSIPELPSERAVGRSSLALMPHGFRQWFRRALKKVFRKGLIRKFEYSADDGTYWEGRIVPIRADGPVTAAMVIASDVTEKRNLEQQALRNARLASIGVLSTGVAHEINNPNNAIQFNASLVSRAWEDAEPILKEYFENNGDFALGGLAYSENQNLFPKLLSEITRNSDRIRRIVENLKHMARQDTGELTEDVDIQQVLESTLMILHNQIQKYTDVCNLTVPDDLPLVKGNSQQLEQVVINILLNALQSLPDRGKGVFISAGVNADDEFLIIRVRDEGRGIAERDMGRLTEPFFTKRSDAGGTGLGLSISRSIMEKHGGSLSFESELDIGTTAIIRIPVTAAIGG